ncbi:hypothetical protein ACEE21_14900 [Clostridium baratii]
MYNIKTKDQLVNEFIANVDANLEIVKAYGSIAESMKNDDAAMVKYLINEIDKIMVASIPEGIVIPGVSVYTSMNGDSNMIRVIDLILRNKYSSNYEFKMKNRIVFSENVFDVLVDFLKCSYIELLIDTLVRKNLEVVNEKLAEIGEQAGNDFVVKIVSPLSNKGKKIVKITDNEVVFVADEERALSLDDILVFCQPTEFLTEDKIKQGFDDEVARFAEAQTTVQFIGVHDPLVAYICDISKLIKPFTLIKKIYSKNIDKVRGNKETFAYYNKDGVYAVIFVSEDGKEVALQPFNTETLEVVDVDVI